ncbi:toxin glutamine deamidase domain-containing protein [Nocardia camponoti]|uniref:Tox-PL domain-containing protein n=1 Tax=Nocardia camponoti TaxID=1616106 RepID=A0A917QAZ5_9NOCA|nr:toxin glutamine deamidase domain-containing protein [Nocardia camponoti]GGK40267.1 hypothetical protein GCM10011591_09890 [Nocardia camponoti]
MGIEIPGELQWVAKYVLGAGDWPDGDETAMRRVADGWTAMASALNTIDDDALKALNSSLSALSAGQTHTELATIRDALLKGDQSGFTSLRKWCEKQAEILEDGANDIEHTKLVIIGTMVIAAIEIAATAWTGIGLIASAAGRVAAQVAVRIAVRQLIARMLTRGAAKAAGRLALRGAAFEALEEGGTDLGARLIQVGQGNRSLDKFGVSDFLLATGAGAVGGAVGGVLGGAGGALADNASGAASKFVGHTVAGATTELGADLSAQVAAAGANSLLTGQDFKLDIGVDTFTSAGAGGVQSSIENGVHSAQHGAPSVPEVGDLSGSALGATPAVAPSSLNGGNPTAPAGLDAAANPGAEAPVDSAGGAPTAPAGLTDPGANGNVGSTVGPGAPSAPGDAGSNAGSPSNVLGGTSTAPAGLGDTGASPSPGLVDTGAPTSAPGAGESGAPTLAPGSGDAGAPTSSPGLSDTGALAPAPGSGDPGAPTASPGLGDTGAPTLAPGLGDPGAPTGSPGLGDGTSAPAVGPTNGGTPSAPADLGDTGLSATPDTSAPQNSPGDSNPAPPATTGAPGPVAPLPDSTGSDNPTILGAPDAPGSTTIVPGDTPPGQPSNTGQPTPSLPTNGANPAAPQTDSPAPASNPNANLGVTAPSPAPPSTLNLPPINQQPGPVDQSTPTVAPTVVAAQSLSATASPDSLPSTSAPVNTAPPAQASGPQAAPVPSALPTTDAAAPARPASQSPSASPSPLSGPPSPNAAPSTLAPQSNTPAPSHTTPGTTPSSVPPSSTPFGPAVGPVHAPPHSPTAPNARALREQLRTQTPPDARTVDVEARRSPFDPNPTRYRVRRFPLGPNAHVMVASVRAHIPNAHLLSPTDQQRVAESIQATVDATLNHAQRLLSGDQFLFDLDFTADPAAADISLSPMQTPADIARSLREHLGLFPPFDGGLSPTDLREISNDIARANTPSRFSDPSDSRDFGHFRLAHIEDATYQAYVEDSLRDGNQFTVGADPRTHPYGGLINDGGRAVAGRANNCLDCSLSALSSFFGVPNISAPRYPDWNEDGARDESNGERGGSERAANWLSSQAEHFPNLPIAAQFDALHNLMTELGPGSAALVCNAWHAVDDNGNPRYNDDDGTPIYDGSHATVIVFPPGATGPVWWDPQAATTSDIPPPGMVADSAALVFTIVDPSEGAQHGGTNFNQGVGQGTAQPGVSTPRVPDLGMPARVGMPRSPEPGTDSGGRGPGPRQPGDQQADRDGDRALEPVAENDRGGIRPSDRLGPTSPGLPGLPTSESDSPTSVQRGPADDHVSNDGDQPAAAQRPGPHPPVSDRQGDAALPTNGHAVVDSPVVGDGPRPSDGSLAPDSDLRQLADVAPELDSAPSLSAVELDSLHARYADDTQAGVSYHRGDPAMGDLPHRVPADPTRFTADTHVTPDGFARIGDQTLTPEEYGDLLRRSTWDGQTPIHLIGCDAASNDFAARLSTHLGVDVLAPTLPAWTDANGNVYTATALTSADGTRHPRIPPDGQWQTHHPNGTTTAHNTATSPGTVDPTSYNTDSARDRSAFHRPAHNQPNDYTAAARGLPIENITRSDPRAPTGTRPFGRERRRSFSFLNPPPATPLEPNRAYRVTDTSGRDRGLFITDDNGNIIEVVTDSGERNNPAFNPDLRAPFPNCTYTVDGGRFTYQTDDQRRVVEARGRLDLVPSLESRRGPGQGPVGHVGQREYAEINQRIRDTFVAENGREPSEAEVVLYQIVSFDGGHLFATQFLGPGEELNMVSQLMTLNRRIGENRTVDDCWRVLEQSIAEALSRVPPPQADFHISLEYDPDRPDMRTPTAIEGLLLLDGVELYHNHYVNVPALEGE